jgi:site-specific DNA-methyltransferase (adenine-specific)
MNIILNNGSTGVACVNTNRDFIGIELDEGYFKIAEKRIKDAQYQGGLFECL